MAAILVALSSLTFAGVNQSKDNTSEDRHLSGFNAVSVAGSFDVYITQGSSESVKVDAPSEIIDRIVTEVEGGVLKIYTKNNTKFNWNWGDHKKMIIYVAPSLKLKLTGSGDLNGKVDVKSLESTISGSGDITVSGHADSSSVSVVGSGDFTGQNLVTTNTTVKVAGSGDARINAADKIEASVVGSGDVHYTGTAKNVSSSKAGSGSVSRM